MRSNFGLFGVAILCSDLARVEDASSERTKVFIESSLKYFIQSNYLIELKLLLI